MSLDVKISSLDSDFEENIRVSMQNRDVVQRLVVPLGERFRATSEGSGQAAFSWTVEYHVYSGAPGLEVAVERGEGFCGV